MDLPAHSFNPDGIEGYHAHVYYQGEEQRALAAEIRESIAARFDVELGRWRDKPVGPHPQPMYQVAFDKTLLPELLPWLMAVRGALSILVHCTTGKNDLLDHTAGAIWLGSQLELNTAIFGDSA
ncbi:DOPA 4,5-dioxygenase family protein [Pontibacterium granulatum]|uniref:DOPA 4,5-dioxygenase family protein n=1 Tax=Pontibacterium granulatum TaxID=2036029 RepID=UPI00249A1B3D|nr:DOPA 4,5-dioxygenase family protein [Pontibacterium granulatum]MDI3325026.1 DOPA 4,5-dioxygenase family protein [Pontibacterium granulatum]